MRLPRLQTRSCWFKSLSLCQRAAQPGKWNRDGAVILCLVALAMGTAAMCCGLLWSDRKNSFPPLRLNSLAWPKKKATARPIETVKKPVAKAKIPHGIVRLTNEIISKLRQNTALRLVGTTALDFTLPNALTGQKVHLSDLLCNKPVVLLFGSFG